MSDLEDTVTYRNRAEELRAIAQDSSDRNRDALLRAAEVFDALAEIAKEWKLSGTWRTAFDGFENQKFVSYASQVVRKNR